MQELSNQVAELEAARSEALERCGDLETQVARLKADNEGLRSIGGEVHDLSSLHDSALKRVDELRKSMQDLGSQVPQSSPDQESYLELRCKALEEDVARLTADNAHLAKDKRKLSAKAEKLEARKSTLKAQLESSEAARKQARDRCEQMFARHSERLVSKDIGDAASDLAHSLGASGSGRPPS